MSLGNGRPQSTLNGRADRLTPRQEQAAVALASGRNESEAADACGGSSRTIRTWLATLPAFGKRIGELRAQMTSAALGRLAASMCRAADALDRLATSAESESVRLGAARAVLELGLKVKETVELEARISLLEQRHGGKP
jgi:hypothetical protein